MKETSKEIMLLRYRIKRYQEMGNGTMCQSLRRQLQRMQVCGTAAK